MAPNAENAPAGRADARADAFQSLATDIDSRNIAQSRPGTQARVLDFKPFEKNTLRAFFSLELASGLILRGCTLHTKNGKYWIGLPAKPYTTDTGAQSWAAIIDFRDKQTAARFQEMATAAAVEAYEHIEGRSMSGLPIQENSRARINGARQMVDYPTAKKGNHNERPQKGTARSKEEQLTPKREQLKTLACC
jgi:hypothetical protein